MSNAVVLLRIVERKIHPTETLFPDFPTNTKVVHLLDINTKVLAQQLTIQAQTIYTACKHQEFLNLNWTRPHRRHKAPNICRILERFQEVYHWVASMIMEQDDLDEQVATATKFIDLANELRNLNNFETLVHVVAGLRCASVYRMRRLWNLIDKDKVELLNNLESVTSSDKAFLELRNAMNTCCAPLIPYLGVYLNNLTFIEDIIVHPPPNTFNFRKMKMIYGVVATLLLYKPKYQIVPDVGIQEAIEYSMRNLAFQSEDEYYKQSLKLEPRQTHP
jgi:son of sevenless-like protein